MDGCNDVVMAEVDGTEVGGMADTTSSAAFDAHDRVGHPDERDLGRGRARPDRDDRAAHAAAARRLAKYRAPSARVGARLTPRCAASEAASGRRSHLPN